LKIRKFYNFPPEFKKTRGIRISRYFRKVLVIDGNLDPARIRAEVDRWMYRILPSSVFHN
jgi:hypothetical protein